MRTNAKVYVMQGANGLRRSGHPRGDGGRPERAGAPLMLIDKWLSSTEQEA